MKTDKMHPDSDLAHFLESLLFTIPEDEPEELREASIYDFSAPFQAAAQSFISGFRDYLATHHAELYEREGELGRSFGSNVYFSLSGHGCGFWDDRDSELGRAFDDALKAYSGSAYRFEELDCLLSRDEETGKVDLAFLPEFLDEQRARIFTVSEIPA
jgi:hypothetical protein